MDVAGHDPDLAFLGRDHPRAIRPDQAAFRPGEGPFDPDHVEDRDPLGDAHDQLDPGVDRFEDRIGRIGRRHIDDADRCAGFGTRRLDRVEHRQIEMLGAALSRGRAAATMPSAMTSQRMMPPKMLTRIASTLGSDRISLNATMTRSRVAPPPTSRKLAGLPP